MVLKLKVLETKDEPKISDLKDLIENLRTVKELLEERNLFNEDWDIYDNIIQLIEFSNFNFGKKKYINGDEIYIPTLDDYDFHLADNEPMPRELIPFYRTIMEYMTQNK